MSLILFVISLLFYKQSYCVLKAAPVYSPPANELTRNRDFSADSFSSFLSQANVRMSLILFVISMVFIATFTPALLIANGLINYYNVVVFYSYYVSSITNPIFYCFLNRNFRNDLRRLMN